MRIAALMALSVASVGLAACGGSSGLDYGSGKLASALDVCSVSCTITKPVSTTPTDTDTDTDTTDDDNDSGVGTGDQNSGNDASLTTGDTTLILETSKLKSTKDTPGLSRLTVDDSAKTAMIEIDTKTADNSKWPKAKAMAEYLFGTNADEASIAVRNMGGTYKEYRSLSYNEDDSSADEVLQVWNWNDSYAAQYRDLTNGGEAGHQAWSFGGTKTAANAVPTSGSATYAGRFTSTSKTWNWTDPNNGRTVSANNIWRVTGTAQATADFATSQVDATLQPETWIGYASLNGASGFTTIDATGANPGSDPNYNSYMNDAVKLHGTIATGTAVGGNSITGTSSMDANQGWVTNQTVNPFNAAFFGANADEMTGVFNLEAVAPDPVGGDTSINDDRRGFIQHSGAFNAQ